MEDKLAHIEEKYGPTGWGHSDAVEDVAWLIAEVKRLREREAYLVRVRKRSISFADFQREY